MLAVSGGRPPDRGGVSCVRRSEAGPQVGQGRVQEGVDAEGIGAGAGALAAAGYVKAVTWVDAQGTTHQANASGIPAAGALPTRTP